MTTNTTTASQPNAAPSVNRDVLQAVKDALSLLAGITIGRQYTLHDAAIVKAAQGVIFDYESAAPALPEPAAAQEPAMQIAAPSSEVSDGFSQNLYALLEHAADHIFAGLNYHASQRPEREKLSVLMRQSVSGPIGQVLRAELYASAPQPLAEVSAAQAVPESGPFTLEQRMPPKDIEVLIYWPCTDGTFEVRVDEWSEIYEDPIGMGGPTICVGEGWVSYGDENVTHWALIAQPTDTTRET